MITVTDLKVSMAGEENYRQLKGEVENITYKLLYVEIIGTE